MVSTSWYLGLVGGGAARLMSEPLSQGAQVSSSRILSPKYGNRNKGTWYEATGMGGMPITPMPVERRPVPGFVMKNIRVPHSSCHGGALLKGPNNYPYLKYF